MGETATPTQRYLARSKLVVGERASARAVLERYGELHGHGAALCRGDGARGRSVDATAVEPWDGAVHAAYYWGEPLRRSSDGAVDAVCVSGEGGAAYCAVDGDDADADLADGEGVGYGV